MLLGFGVQLPVIVFIAQSVLLFYIDYISSTTYAQLRSWDNGLN